MNFAMIYSMIIIFLAIPTFFTDFAGSLPLGLRIFVIVFTLVILWSYTFFFKTKGRLGFGGVLLLILFYFFTFVIIIPTGVGSTVISILERGGMKPPITIGSKDSVEEIYIVYHPGASDFTISTLKILAENMAQDGYKVTLFSVNKDLQLDLQEIKAIGFASPIYAGNIRKQLIRYIEEDNLSEKKCFIVVTGSDREGIEKDTLKVAKIVEERGGVIIGRTKFITSDNEVDLQEKVNLFSDELLNKL